MNRFLIRPHVLITALIISDFPRWEPLLAEPNAVFNTTTVYCSTKTFLASLLKLFYCVNKMLPEIRKSHQLTSRLSLEHLVDGWVGGVGREMSGIDWFSSLITRRYQLRIPLSITVFSFLLRSNFNISLFPPTHRLASPMSVLQSFVRMHGAHTERSVCLCLVCWCCTGWCRILSGPRGIKSHSPTLLLSTSWLHVRDTVGPYQFSLFIFSWSAELFHPVILASG